MNGIDPKYVFWLGVIVTIETAIGQGAVKLTNLVPETMIPSITGWCTLLAFIGNVIMTALAGYSSKTAGPLVKPLVLVAVLLGCMFGLADSASAKPLNLLKPIAAANATAQSPSDKLTKLMTDLSNVTQEVVTGVIADIQAADADAGALTNPSDPASFRDPIAHACYPAEVKFLQSLPVATPPTGKYVLVQLFQKKRDFVIQLQAGLPSYLKLGCAALLGDEVQIFTKSMALVGVSVAANSLLPGSGAIALPSL